MIPEFKGAVCMDTTQNESLNVRNVHERLLFFFSYWYYRHIFDQLLVCLNTACEYVFILSFTAKPEGEAGRSSEKGCRTAETKNGQLLCEHLIMC